MGESIFKQQDIYKIIFNQSQDALLLIKDYEFILSNQAAAELLGYGSFEDLIGIHPSKISPEKQPGDELSYIKANQLMDIAYKEGCKRFDWIHQKKDGAEFPVEVVLTRLTYDSECLLHVSLRDISERKEREKDVLERLNEREIMLNATFESTADGILIVDVKGRVIDANQRFLDMWKIPQDVFDKKKDETILTSVHEQLIDPKQFLQKIYDLYNSDITDRDIMRFKDHRVFERYSCPLMINDEKKGRVWSFRDITEQKHAEELIKLEELRHKALLQLNQMRDFPIDQVFIFSLETAIGLTGSDSGFVFIYSERDQSLVLESISSHTENIIKKHKRNKKLLFKDAGIIAKCITDKAPIIFYERMMDDLPSFFKKDVIKNLLMVPVIFQDCVVAVTGVINKKQDYKETDIRHLILLMDGVWKQKVQKESELLLKESEERYKKLVTSSLAGIIITRLSGEIFETNHAFEKMLGYKIDHMRHARIYDFFARKNDWKAITDELSGSGVVFEKEVSFKKSGGDLVTLFMNINKEIISGEEMLLTTAVDITKQREFSRALEESRNRYFSLFDEAPISLWLEDFSEIKKYVDQLKKDGITNLQEYLDKNPEELYNFASMVQVVDVNNVSLKLYEAGSGLQLIENIGKIFTPKSLGHLKDGIISLSNGETVFEVETENYTLKGKLLNIILKMTVAGGYEESLSRVHISIIDITDQKKTQDEILKLNIELEQRVLDRTKELQEAMDQLTLSEKKFRTLFNSANDAIFIHGEDGLIVEVNDRVYDRFGFTRNELIGNNFNLLEVEEPENVVDERSSKLKRKGRLLYETVYQAKDKRKIYVEISSRKIKYNEKEAVLNIVRDVTKRKQFEEDLKRARDEAEAANRAKSEFLANMSHEIRTPLNAVTGYSELLSSIATDDRQAKYTEAIKTAGRSLLTLINDILDLSKIEAGKMDFEPLPVNPRSILWELQQIFSVKIKEKVLDFNLSISDDFPEIVLLDEARLRQVLLNIIGNAIKFTDSGSITVRAEKLSKGNNVTDLLFKITDTGIGISKKDIKNIFDSFHQQSGQSTRQYGGTGLGLAISKKLVELMNGSISVASKKGKGSDFTIVLHNVEEVASEIFIEDDKTSTSVRFSESTVLVVDDVDSNRYLLVELLEQVGLQTILAKNGAQAVTLAAEKKPSLIIMDVRMPVMDGVAAAKKLRADPVLSSIPLIALSASTQKDKEEKLLASGFDSFLTKPVIVSFLYREISRFIPYTEVETQVDQKPVVIDHSDFVSTMNDPAYYEPIRSEIFPIIEKLSSVVKMGDVHNLIEVLRKQADQFQLISCSQYADQLDNAAKHIDVTQISEIVSDIKNILEIGEKNDR